MPHISSYQHNNFFWHVVDKPTKKQLDWLKDNFDYEETDFKDFAGNKIVKILLDIPSQVPKLKELLNLK